MVFRAVGRKLGINVVVVLGGFLCDCFVQLTNLLIVTIVSRYGGIPSSWSEIMNRIDMVVMTLCCSVLLAELLVGEDTEVLGAEWHVGCKVCQRIICVGFRAVLGYKACRGAWYCCRAGQSCRFCRGT